MRPRVVGLTGGVATGKSEAAAYLRELGAYVVDADLVAREVADLPEIRRQLKQNWPQVFTGEILDRKALGRIIFASGEEREKLNRMLHPIIVKRMLREVETCNQDVCVLVAPLLIESGLHQMVDEIWVLDVPLETQAKRLVEREHITREEALRIIESQLPAREKVALAHHIIDNSGPPEKMREQLRKEWEALLAETQ